MKICDYGCGREAKHYFKIVKKWCCSKSQNSCPKMRKDHSIRMTGKNNPMFGKQRAFTREEIRKQIKGRRLTISKIRKKYPFFARVEEMRYNPDVTNKEIQVHCKNHNCENSKEKDGWFTPTKSQIIERRRALEHPDGNDGRYFYCSEECKMECPLYYSRGGDPFQNTPPTYTNKEYQQFREYVLKRDDHTCQYCGDPAVDVHHERPQKLEPFFALDPDLAWSTCEKCHYKYGHKGECSTVKIADKIC